jgi:bifunctional DNA-binding transcriptional regulator/antitoxin component of YhaV-PrlF toxin-antitoxin module
MRFLRKVGQRGSLTLPSELREVLSIDEGDLVEFEVIGVVRRSADKRTSFPSSSANAPVPVES